MVLSNIFASQIYPQWHHVHFILAYYDGFHSFYLLGATYIGNNISAEVALRPIYAVDSKLPANITW